MTTHRGGGAREERRGRGDCQGNAHEQVSPPIGRARPIGRWEFGSPIGRWEFGPPIGRWLSYWPR